MDRDIDLPSRESNEGQPRSLGFGAQFFSHHTNSDAVVIETHPEQRRIGACQIIEAPDGERLSFPSTQEFPEIGAIGDRVWSVDEVFRAFSKTMGMELPPSTIDYLRAEAGKPPVQIPSLPKSS